MAPHKHSYLYQCEIINAKDLNNTYFEVDLGFHVWKTVGAKLTNPDMYDPKCSKYIIRFTMDRNKIKGPAIQYQYDYSYKATIYAQSN